MVKLKDIAAAAGLSVPTVSKALRNTGELNEQTVAVVQQIAESMGYEIRETERAKSRSNVIGVVAPELNSSYYVMILDSLRKALREQKMQMLLMLTDFTEEQEEKCIKELLRVGVCGVICFAEHEEVTESFRRLVTNNKTVPFLLVSMVEKTDLCDSLCMDADSYVHLALEHLIKLGHRRIGYVGETLTENKRQAFEQYLRDRGLPVNEEYIVVTDSRFEKSGKEGMNRILACKELPTAIYAAYDEIARGVIYAAKRAGYAVPQDFSVVSASDIYSAKYMDPPLTTVTNFVGDMGELACDLMMARLARPNKPVENISLNPRLVVRESTATLQ